MPKTKIIHIIGNLDHGGAERFVIDLCNEMGRKDIDVTLVSLCFNDREHSFLDQISENVNYVSFGKGHGLSVKVIFRLTKWLLLQQPDVVHTHLNSSEYLTLYRLWSNKTRFYHTIHNMAEAECPKVAIKFLRRLFYSFNRVIPVTISVQCRESFRRYYHLTNDQLIENARPLPMPTSSRAELLKSYAKRPAEILLVHIGRISSEKNQRMLIQSVRHLNRSEPVKCRLLLIGEVKDPILYKQLLALAEADPYIEFLGVKRNIADYLSIADAFCLCSHFEGMPISIIEAMSAGCIPVCTAVGGITDMIHDGVDGFLSAPNDLQAYCNSLKKIIYGTDLEEIRKQAILTYYKRYTISTSADNYLKMYGQVV